MVLDFAQQRSSSQIFQGFLLVSRAGDWNGTPSRIGCLSLSEPFGRFCTDTNSPNFELD